MSVTLPNSIDESNVTDEYIEALITCEKEILNLRRPKQKTKRLNREVTFKVVSKDKVHSFQMRIREHCMLPDNFSVILIYINQNNEFTILFRCNGPHSGREVIDLTHFTYHTHRITPEAWSRSSRTMPDRKEETNKYSTLQEAMLFFVEKCNIIDEKGFFKSKPELERETDHVNEKQMTMFDEYDENDGDDE